MEKAITATGLESRKNRQKDGAGITTCDAQESRFSRCKNRQKDGAIPRDDASKMSDRADDAADLLDSIAWYYRGAFLSDRCEGQPYTPEWALFWAHVQTGRLRMDLTRHVACKLAKGDPAGAPLSKQTKFAYCTADEETRKDVEKTALATRDCFLDLRRLLEGRATPAPESNAELKERLAIGLNTAIAGIKLLRKHICID